MSELVKIPFHNSEILAVDVDGKPQIVLKPAFDHIGLDADQQIRKLKRQPWAVTGVTTGTGSDGKTYQMVTADVRTFLMALATIPVSRVNEEARPLLVAYQSEVADVIEQYFTAGGAINPRANQDQLTTLIGRAEGQARVLRALDGIVDPAWLEAKARHVAARALGEEPEIDPATRPLSVGEFLSDMGASAAEQRRIASTFGKRIKAAYREVYKSEPLPVKRFVDGAMRDVAGYTESHRHLFNHVWAEYYAPVAA